MADRSSARARRSGGGAPASAPLVAAAIAVCAAVPGLSAAATLAADLELSNEGYFQLRWETEEPVRLVESSDADFADARTVYAGADTARVISGKPDGLWHYRLEAASDGRVLSDTVTVTVRHHSLERALTFFALGAVVFGATLVLVVQGSRRGDERR